MLLMMNFLLSILFLFLNHPMSMGLVLLMQTIIISLITGMLTINFWFSYILFLIMVGGLLVLFIYMTSIASNEMFTFSNYLTWSIFICLIITILSYIFIDSFYLNLFFHLMDNLSNNYSMKINFNLTKFMNYPSLYMIWFMIVYLFITLIAVVKISKIEYGPLRQKF